MQRKYPPQFRMYLKEDEVLIWEKLKKIADVEKRPVAEIVREQVHSYVRLHEPGNPQQRLDTIMATGKAYNCTIHRFCKHPRFLKQQIFCEKETCPLIVREKEYLFWPGFAQRL